MKKVENTELKSIEPEKGRGLSVVVTTLILLVVAVLLAVVVSYYAADITLTRSQVEDVRLSKGRIWVNQTGAVAAFKLQSVGGKDTLIDGITVRSENVDWGNVYMHRVPASTTVTEELIVVSPERLTGENVTIDGRTYENASIDIPLVSGGVLLFYVKEPVNIRMDDIGTTISIGVYTNNGRYTTNCNVESATQF